MTDLTIEAFEKEQGRTRTRIPMPPEIAKGIIQVMKEIGAVEKRGYNSFHKYRFAAAGDVLAEVQPKMAAAGIDILPIEVSRQFDDARGMLEVVYEMLIFHESGVQWEERVKQTGYARAKDSKGGWDDKAINKCHTNARKYFIMALFNIPTGDIADADEDRSDYQGDAADGPPRDTSPPRNDPREEKKQYLKDWCDIAKREIALLKTDKDFPSWESMNRGTLDKVYAQSDTMYDTLIDAMNVRREELGLPPYKRK